MPNQFANLKPIRPFRPMEQKGQADSKFQTWLNKAWKKRALEVGCGVGLHPIQWAQQNPESAIIAIERTQEKFAKFHSRLNNHSLPNIFPVNQEAQSWLQQNMTANSVDQLFLLYPNPYPKESQANKRWHRNPFFQKLLSLVKVGGQIHFATNEVWLFDEALSYFESYWNLKLIRHQSLGKESETMARTHFEKKYLQRDQVCQDAIFQKTDQTLVAQLRHQSP